MQPRSVAPVISHTTLKLKAYFMYQCSFSKNEDDVHILHADSDTPIPMDSDDQRFCDFLTWASEHADSGIRGRFGLQGRARFFSDAPRLTEYYKSSGDLLVAQEVPHPDGERRELLTGRSHEAGHGGMYHNLFKAFAMPQGSGLAADGGAVPKESKTWITGRLRDRLNEMLQDEDADIRRLSTWSIERCFVFIDVSDFSQFPARQQCLIINSLVRTVESLVNSKIPEIRQAASDIEASLCIGDGYIYVFRRSSLAAFFATALAYLIELLAAKKLLPVSYHFRMSVHAGPVYGFWDPGRNGWNYIGDGINGGQRVLGAIGKEVDDVLFISAEIKRSLTADFDGTKVYSMLLSSLQNRGRRLDKHGNPWRVYEVNHTHTMSSSFDECINLLSR
jgi:hypothetical protein